MYRFLLTPRWLGRLALALLVAVVCVLLGSWQWGRGQEKGALNHRLDRNLSAPVTDVTRLLSTRRALDPAREQRRVRAVGEYDPAHTLLVRLRPYDGQVGFYVLVPLVTGDGSALLVNRGWIPSGQDGRPAAVPSAPGGRVTVVARARVSEPPSTTGTPPQGQVSRIDVPAIARRLPYPLLRGYGDAVTERPAPAKAPARLEPPGPGLSGINYAYAVQWWMFSGLALGAYVVLARREARRAGSA